MGWREQVFPVEGRAMEWAQPQYHLIARVEDKAAGHMGFGGFDLYCDSRLERVVGVGGVVAHPDYQGQGVPAKMFAALRSRAPELTGCNVYTLFCPQRLAAYYQRHDFKLFTGPVTIKQNGVSVSTSFCFMYSGVQSLGSRVALTTNPW